MAEYYRPTIPLMSLTDSSLSFARHYARLVWLLHYDGNAADAQIASLTAVVSAARRDSLVVTRNDWRLMVNGQPVPEEITGVQDLVAQLIGHSIAEIRTDAGATPSDLLLVARILATEPVSGDGGRNVLARLHALDARSVHVAVESPGSSRPFAVHDASPAATAGPARALPAGRVRAAVLAHPRQTASAVPPPLGADVIRGKFPGQPTSPSVTPRGSMDHLFQQLDAARGATAIARYLDALVDLAVESVRTERHDVVADVFHGLVTRESATDDKVAERMFGLCIRRLSTPTTLRCIADLLPRMQGEYDRYLVIFTRAADVGAEALVDALISAPTIVDRRVYYDALLRVRTGARTLMHLLGDSRWYVVRNAVDLLAEMRMTEAEGELTRLLGHQDDRVRTAAASALAKLAVAEGAQAARAPRSEALSREQPLESSQRPEHTKSVESLIWALEREKDSRVQMVILASLGQLATPIAIEKLAEIAIGAPGPQGAPRPMRLRVAAVHALGDIHSAVAHAALQSLLHHTHPAIRGAASWVMMGRRE
jgi:hypothetical protein